MQPENEPREVVLVDHPRVTLPIVLAQLGLLARKTPVQKRADARAFHERAEAAAKAFRTEKTSGRAADRRRRQMHKATTP